MAKLSKVKMARIEAQAKEYEEEMLLDRLFESSDENVREALEQALVVVKLIYSEEIDEEIRAVRDDLIRQEHDEINRKRIEKVRQKEIMEQATRQRKISDDDYYQRKLYPVIPGQYNVPWIVDDDIMIKKIENALIPFKGEPPF